MIKKFDDFVNEGAPFMPKGNDAFIKRLIDLYNEYYPKAKPGDVKEMMPYFKEFNDEFFKKAHTGTLDQILRKLTIDDFFEWYNK